MFIKWTFIALAILAITPKSQQHTYHSGVCPSVEPMQGFDIKQVSFCCFFIIRCLSYVQYILYVSM